MLLSPQILSSVSTLLTLVKLSVPFTFWLCRIFVEKTVGLFFPILTVFLSRVVSGIPAAFEEDCGDAVV